MHITLKCEGKEYPMTVEETDDVMTVKMRLDNVIDLSVDRMELHFNALIMEKNGYPIVKYGVTDGSEIVVRVLPNQLHTSLLFPSGAIYSTAAILLIFFSTHNHFPSLEETTEATALISSIVLIIYLGVKSILSLTIDVPSKSTIGVYRAIATSMSIVAICIMLTYDVCHRKSETSVLSTIVGGINCMSCLAGLLYHHSYFSSCYNQYNELVDFPQNILYRYISCPNLLFEALFFTAFMICTSFTVTSVLLCVAAWTF
ncbi:hypothetical protein EIN_033530, partial [Entamoeba invadens IP1]